MKKKKVIIWGVIVSSIIIVINFLHEILGGHREFDGQRGGHGWGQAEMGQAGSYGSQGGFAGHHRFMNVSHHGGGFHWVALLIGLAVLVLFVRWYRNRAKTSSMNEFIDTALLSSHTQVSTQNARILDQWEKNMTTKKENE